MNKKDNKNKKGLKAILSSIAAVAIVSVLAITSMAPSRTLASEADISTEKSYEDTLEKDIMSTKDSGRVWTDKSVEKNTDGKSFDITYSALATGQRVMGKSPKPLDVVFIVDVSSSMDKHERIEKSLAAANQSMDTLLNANEYNRLSVVTFSGLAEDTEPDAEVLLPLGRYKKVSDKDKFLEKKNDKLSAIYVDENGNKQEKTVTYGGGTNTQAGFALGMKQLLDVKDTTVNIDGDEVSRTPVVIFLSDGAPTYSINPEYTKGNWWDALSKSNEKSTLGNGSTYYYGNGLLAMMTASYNKNKISGKYSSENKKVEAQVYTIGLEVDQIYKKDEWGNTTKNTDAINYAKTVMDPATNLEGTAGFAGYVATSLDNYKNKLPIQLYQPYDSSNHNCKLNHPKLGKDISSLSDLKYVTKYYPVTDVQELDAVFKEILEKITVPSTYPTRIKKDSAIDGYLTYTDNIGEYMNVKSVNSISIYDQTYDKKNVSTSENGIETYEFSDSVRDSINPDKKLKLSNIKINVNKKNINNQILTIRIPAGLIPLRIDNVEMTKEGIASFERISENPIKISYTVELDESTTLKDVSEEYIKKNTDNDGNVQFYSNKYSGKKINDTETIGDAYTEFTPALTSPNYYMQENAPIYRSRDGDKGKYTFSDPVKNFDEIKKSPDGTEFYIKVAYCTNKGIEYENLVRKKDEFHEDNLDLDEKTKILSVKKGTPRTYHLNDLRRKKEINVTNTASMSYYPVFKASEGDKEDSLVFYLGNNGKLSIPVSKKLDIKKTVKTSEGCPAPDKTFDFNLSAPDMSGRAVLVKVIEYGKEDQDILLKFDEKGDAHFTLKDQQTLSLPYMIGKYKVIEDSNNLPDGFKHLKQATTTNEKTNVDTVEVTNQYEVEPTDLSLKVKKILTGRKMTEDDSFTFQIKADTEGAPMPDSTELTINGVEDKESVTGYFEKIKYTKPGKYGYTITETGESVNGITISQADYTVTVVVEDLENGKLKATATINQIIDDDGNEVPEKKANVKEVVFTNNYKSEPVTLSGEDDLKVKKTLTGRKMTGDDSFTFQIKGDTKETPMPKSDTITLKGKQGADTVKGNFGDIKYTKPGTYKYTITETVGDAKGITYSKAIYTVAVEVEDSGKGKLEATATMKQITDDDGSKVPENEEKVKEVLFTNNYKSEPVTLLGKDNLKVKKTLTGRKITGDDSFTFQIKGDTKETPMPKSDTITLKGKQGVDTVEGYFGDIKYTKLGTYKYTITETVGDAKGITYSKAAYTVAVEVKDSRTGKLEATTTINQIIDDDGKEVKADAKEAAFTNDYSVPDLPVDPTEYPDPNKPSDDPSPEDLVDIPFVKEFTGRENNKWLPEDKFEFELSRVTENAPMPGNKKSVTTTISKPMQKFSFGIINFTKADAGKEYFYKVTEIVPTGGVKDQKGNIVKDGITYHQVGNDTSDPYSYEFNIKIRDDGEGKLWAETTAPQKTVSKFVNTYKAEEIILEGSTNLKVKKTLTGRKMTEDDSFTFKIEAIPGEGDTKEPPMPKSDTIILEGKQGVDTVEGYFGDIKYTKPGEYKYKITETGNSKKGITISKEEYIVIVSVQDDKSGKLTAKPEIAKKVSGDAEYEKAKEILFTNVYKTTDIPVDPTDDPNPKKTSDDPSPEDYVDIPFVKEFTGRENNKWLPKDKFEFELSRVTKNAPMPESNREDGRVITTINKSMQEFDFGEILFKQEHVGKTFTYKVTEIVPTDGAEDQKGNIVKDGITYHQVGNDTSDPYSYTFNITIHDKGNGTLSATTDSFDKKVPKFVNTYKAEEVVLKGKDDLKVKKTLTGRKMTKSDKFTFQITADTEGAPMPANDKLEIDGVKDEESVTGNFGDIKYTEPGKYGYTITETVGDAKGITYSQAAYTVTVKVTDSKTGKLEATATMIQIADDQKNEVATDKAKVEVAAFTNAYAPSMSGVGPSFEKELVNRNWTDNDVFTFTLKPVTENAPMPSDSKNGEKVLQVTKENKKFNFGEIVFTGKDLEDAGAEFIDGVRSAKFVYEVEETEGKDVNMQYDTLVRTFTITVVDDGTGEMKATSTGVENSSTFENIYYDEVPYSGEIGLESNTKLIGTTMDEKQFILDITANDEASKDKAHMKDMHVTVPNQHGNSSGVEETFTPNYFDTIVFKKEDIGKTYSYTIKQTTDDKAYNKVSDWPASEEDRNGYYRDDNEYHVEIKVTEKDHKIVPITTIGDETYDEGKRAVLPFVNYYCAHGILGPDGEVQINAIKTLIGSDGLHGEDFTFDVKDAAGNVVSTGTNDAEGNITFDNIKYSEKDLATPNITYTVTERDPGDGITATKSGFQIFVHLTDNKDGTIGIEVEYPDDEDPLEFENVYQTADLYLTINGNKVLNTPEGSNLTLKDIVKDYTFTLKQNGEPVNNTEYDATEPADDATEPADDTTEPADDTTEPADDATEPADDTTEPADDTTEPADGTTEPADGTTEPADGTTKSVDDVTESMSDTSENKTLENPMPELMSAKMDEAGNIKFGTIHLDESVFKEIPYGKDGIRTVTFSYIVTEEGSHAGVTNGKPQTFTITVTDHGDGSLSATVDNGSIHFTYTNTYGLTEKPSSPTEDGKIEMIKNLSGRDLVADEFTFTLHEVGTDNVWTGTNDANGKVHFPTVSFKAPGTYYYEVHEQYKNQVEKGITYDPTTYMVVAEVVDNKDGTMSVTWSSKEKVVFNNNYKTKPTGAIIASNKVMCGRDPEDGEFSFQLVDKETEKVIQTVKNGKHGNVEFAEIEYTEAKDYHYVIREVAGQDKNIKYDKQQFNVTVHVKDDKEGHLNASVEYTDGTPIFKNIYNEPAKPEPAKPEPTKPEPTKPEPTKPEPTKPEPTKPVPAKPEPARPAASNKGSHTGYSSNAMAWLGLVALSGATLVGATYRKKRNKK